MVKAGRGQHGFAFGRGEAREQAVADVVRQLRPARGEDGAGETRVVHAVHPVFAAQVAQQRAVRGENGGGRGGVGVQHFCPGVQRQGENELAQDVVVVAFFFVRADLLDAELFQRVGVGLRRVVPRFFCISAVLQTGGEFALVLALQGATGQAAQQVSGGAAHGLAAVAQCLGQEGFVVRTEADGEKGQVFVALRGGGTLPPLSDFVARGGGIAGTDAAQPVLAPAVVGFIRVDGAVVFIIALPQFAKQPAPAAAEEDGGQGSGIEGGKQRGNGIGRQAEATRGEGLTGPGGKVTLPAFKPAQEDSGKRREGMALLRVNWCDGDGLPCPARLYWTATAVGIGETEGSEAVVRRFGAIPLQLRQIGGQCGRQVGCGSLFGRAEQGGVEDGGR